MAIHLAIVLKSSLQGLPLFILQPRINIKYTSKDYKNTQW